MRFRIEKLARAVEDVDFSAATSAEQTGPAQWIDDGELEIPFDRELSTSEADAVVLLLGSATDTEANMRAACATYLARPAPTTAQNTAQIKLLTRLVLAMVGRARM